MKKTTYILLMVLSGALAQAQLLPTYGGERAGLSALSFLKNDMSPRSQALGGASTALSGDAYAIYHNPAGMTNLDATAISLSHYFIGGGINQSWLSGIFPIDDASSIGASFNMLNSGALEERTEFQPNGTGRVFYANNASFGVSYARQLSSQFEIGVTLKYIFEQLADYYNHTAAVDVGFLYQTDWKELQFSVLVRNFGGNSSLSGTYIASGFNRLQSGNLEDNTLPNVFSLGVSMVPYEEDRHRILTAIQLNHPNDNAENYRLGIEYEYMRILAVRAGYKINVTGQSWPTFGMGIRYPMGGHPVYFDYSVNPTNHLGFQQNIGIRIELNKDLRE
ncbi:MAG: PorV/PorQ family protein [Flavobacteriia bacterium]|nr:PorV/PorQ family protein [Flavobacteriia bacterium]